MSQLSQLSQALINEISVRRPTIDELRSRTRRRNVRRRSLGAGSLALAIGVAIVVASVGTSSVTPTSPNKPQLTSYYQAAINVSNSTLESVGLPVTVAIPTRVNPTLSTAGTNGVVSYVGAEYCPYCAIQRWGLLVALSKFGTFTNLDHEIFSSSSDTYPHLASWSFVGAKYTSKYFRFEPVELNSEKRTPSGGYEPLEKMTEPQRIAYDKFNPQGELPFVDFGNHYVTLGASSSPSVLEGLSLSAIGQQLNNPKSPVALAVDGSANYFIASLCSMAQTDAPAICSTSRHTSGHESSQPRRGIISNAVTRRNCTRSAADQCALARLEKVECRRPQVPDCRRRKLSIPKLDMHRSQDFSDPEPIKQDRFRRTAGHHALGDQYQRKMPPEPKLNMTERAGAGNGNQ